jgi:diaminohydroxyphosphoribosylaminopyrimidine deaminase / 5-amino-6-(5-phosphoribosylamino)uracil reductase
LDRAFELAEQAKGGVAPRPAVGAVVARDGKIIGEGATEARPGEHAEAIALAQAGERARGAVLFCTLEPHGFQGVSPPCTDTIIAAGISTVVAPYEDPNPAVSGGGFSQLVAAGIKVVREASDEQVKRARLLVEGFAHHLETGRPLVTLKLATSLDGKIATRTGESKWITNEASRALVHVMRRQTDALITGIGTVLADQPRLTARDSDGNPTGRPLLRVIIDTDGRMPADAPLLDEPGEVLWIVGENTNVESPHDNVSIVISPLKNGKIDLSAVLDELGSRGLHNAMIEAGAGLAGAFVEAGLVDKVAAFIAPKIIGGSGAPGPLAGQGIASINEALSLENLTHIVVEGDILVEGYVSRGE